MHPRERLQKIIDDSTQLIRDIQYWNELNPLDTPIDVEPDRVMLHLARGIAARWDAGERSHAGLQISRLEEYGAEIAKENP